MAANESKNDLRYCKVNDEEYTHGAYIFDYLHQSARIGDLNCYSRLIYEVAMAKYSSVFGLVLVFAIVVSGQLTVDYYKNTCPNAESIITQSITASAQTSNAVPISLLRLFAHDCFVDGCDASILISSTPKHKTERDFPDNQNFPSNPFDAVVEAKKAVEAVCPGVVSCADILAIAARDSVVISGGPSWSVLKGRRDGKISKYSHANGHLPGANYKFNELIANFSTMGLNMQDLVALSGAHTIGFIHCNQLTQRLYSFNGTSVTDPSLNPSLADTLKSICPQSGADPSTIEAMDIHTPFLFDNIFFQNLQQGMGVLFSDQVLYSDATAKTLIDKYSQDQNLFFSDFVQSMIKFGNVGIKTGSQGEIRKDCTVVNKQKKQKRN